MSPWFPPRELKHSISIKQIKEEKREKNKPRGNKIKRGPDENVDRENHLKRFEDFSRLHILEGEKERERDMPETESSIVPGLSRFVSRGKRNT
jgi:hypothetical protein